MGDMTLGDALFPEGTGAFWTTTLRWAAVFVVGWVGVYCVLGCSDQVHRSRTQASRATWSLKLAMLSHHVAISILTVVALVGDSTTSELFLCFGCASAGRNMIRSPAALPSAPELVPITIGYMAADLVFYPCWMVSKSKADNYLMILHHLGSMVVWPLCVLHNICTRYVLLLMFTEVSSIFLTLKFVLEQTERKGTLFKFNGLVFSFSFVGSRLILALPQLMAIWRAPPWDLATWRVLAPELPDWSRFFALALIIPHIMNLFWGVKVVQGTVRVLSPKRRGAKPE